MSSTLGPKWSKKIQASSIRSSAFNARVHAYTHVCVVMFVCSSTLIVLMFHVKVWLMGSMLRVLTVYAKVLVAWFIVEKY